MNLYLIRHGESEGNKENKFRGRINYKLTSNGIKQANEVAHYLSIQRIDFEHIYSSPLKRALKTAEIIAETLNVKLSIMEEFNNIELGEWEGKKKDYIKEHYKKEWQIWIKEPEKLALKNMESLSSIKKRVLSGINKLKAKHKGNIIIVTHRVVLKLAIAALIDIKDPSFWKIHIDTAALTIVDWREPTGWTLKGLNANHYLSKYIEENV